MRRSIIFRGFNVNSEGNTKIYLNDVKYIGDWIVGFVCRHYMGADKRGE